MLFPNVESPPLIAMVVGTQGLGDDAAVLSKPGHARKVSAICRWLNEEAHGMVAWSKHDPTALDQRVPAEVVDRFPQHRSAFERYGREIYGFASSANGSDIAEWTRALTAFLDLNFAERGFGVLAAQQRSATEIRTKYQSSFMPALTVDDVCSLLDARKYVIIEGPPGTGKTRLAQEAAGDRYPGRSISIQFHPNTTYESFVGGLAPAYWSRRRGPSVPA